MAQCWGISLTTIRKRDRKWHVQVRRSGYSKTRTFTHKADAHTWARLVEREIDTDGLNSGVHKLRKTRFKDLINWYREEISKKKRGGSAEGYRLNMLQKYFPISLSLAQVTSRQVAQYRDQRIDPVKSATVHRDLGLLHHCFEVAGKEWGVLIKTNPGRSGNRRVAQAELSALHIPETKNGYPRTIPLTPRAIGVLKE